MTLDTSGSGAKTSHYGSCIMATLCLGGFGCTNILLFKSNVHYVLRRYSKPYFKILQRKGVRMSSTIKCTGRELSIPTPVGNIAALEWGPSDGIKVLFLHGWQDNAMSCQPLVPHLSPKLHIIAIDFMGHGLSPHLGLGGQYTHFGLLNHTYQVVKALNWKQFSIIGHSMGAMVGLQLAAIYPQKIERLVTLDIMYPQVEATLALNAAALPFILKQHTLMEIRENSPPIEFEWNEIVKAFSKDRRTSEENILMLLSRAVRPAKTDNKWVFTRDHRIRILNVPKLEFTEPETIMTMFENYTGAWLAIMARGDDVNPKKLEREKQVRERYKSLQLFRVERVKGTHFIHMDHPDIVGKYINSIFDENTSKL